MSLLGSGRGYRNVREVRDGLRAAVFEDFKILGPEIRDLMAFRIGDHRIHLHQIDSDADHPLRARLFGSSREKRQQSESEEDESAPHDPPCPERKASRILGSVRVLGCLGWTPAAKDERVVTRECVEVRDMASSVPASHSY